MGRIVASGNRILGGLFGLLAALAAAGAAARETPPSDADRPTLVTAEWPGYTHRDGTGLYFALLNMAFGVGGYDVVFRPWRRAQAEMGEGRYDGIIGEHTLKPYAYPAWPIDTNRMAVVFQRSTFERWPGRDALGTHSIAWVRGYNVERFAARAGVPVRQVTRVTDLPSGLRMLAGGRFEVLIDYEDDIIRTLPALGLDPTRFVVEPLDLDTGLLMVGFRRDARGVALARRFDAGMAAAARDGRLAEAFRRYGREEDLPAIRPTR